LYDNTILPVLYDNTKFRMTKKEGVFRLPLS
jgi:hypothetical protein